MEANAVNRHSSSAGNPYNQTIVVIIKIVVLVVVCLKRAEARTSSIGPDSGFMPPTMLKFLGDMEREKTISFTSQQLAIATDNFKHLLGSGGFGSVYKGVFSNGTMVAVKVLNGTSNKRIEEQFKAEVSTLGRTHHVNLVRLYGYCFEKCLRALVYEYMGNGSLDHYLFRENKKRRNMDVTLPDSQEWFPTWVWTKFEKGELGDLMSACAIEAKDTEMAERMVKLSLCCVQYRPESRPLMSLVVKMLEGALEVPTPSNPFRFMNAAPSPGFLPLMAWDPSAFDSSTSQMVTGSTFVNGTPIMKKYGICAPSN
ncbi:hypothetical protein RJ639_013387 [Escallonia herrerae]|uniref:non-specific serine/threonine protein kinase n=1 Tax=Escallonia herrerae TaxID=1293975 RepID=A0AA88VHU8_9ASTE|nr:hypothetical protein RJ639_013387 [Escallonia herrerae]